MTHNSTLIIGSTTLPADIQAEIHRIIDLWCSAQEQDCVAVQCNGHDHFHSRSDRLQRFHFHAMKPGIWLVRVLVGEQTAYALVTKRRPAVGGEIPFRHGSGNALAIDGAEHGDDGITAFGRQQGADNFHDFTSPVLIHEGSDDYGLRNEITWPGGLPASTADFSPLNGRKVILHHDTSDTDSGGGATVLP